jgi:hypothetical protein
MNWFPLFFAGLGMGLGLIPLRQAIWLACVGCLAVVGLVLILDPSTDTALFNLVYLGILFSPVTALSWVLGVLARFRMR